MVSKLQPSFHHLSVSGDGHVLNWKHPPEGFSKINVDGSFDQGTKSVGLRVVCRDHVGNILFSGSAKLDYVQSPLHAKMMAVNWV
ncbi:hypothetical protein REPUB_Repub03eG0142600 [Reevesia pubescens]